MCACICVLSRRNSGKQSISSGRVLDLCLYRKRVRLGIPPNDLRLLLPPRQSVSTSLAGLSLSLCLKLVRSCPLEGSARLGPVIRTGYFFPLIFLFARAHTRTLLVLVLAWIAFNAMVFCYLYIY